MDVSKIQKDLGGTLPLMLRNKVAKVPNHTLQCVKNKSGVFVRYSYSQVYQHVVEMAWSLGKLGVRKGDRVGMMSDNRREWFIADYAVMSLGACDVPRGCDSMGVEMRFILNYAGCRVSFFENARQLQKVLDNIEEVPSLKTAILFDHADEKTLEEARGKGLDVVYYSTLESEGSQISREEWMEVEKGMESIAGDDVCTIIFTSGTTGVPKGVQLTHDNMIAQCEAAPTAFGLAQSGDIWLTVLPVWHSYERAFQYIVVAMEGGFAYSKPIASVMLQDMQLVRPQWMNAVPRLWEAVSSGLKREIGKYSSLTKTLFKYSTAYGKLYHSVKTKALGRRCRFNWYPRFMDIIVWAIPFILLTPGYFLGEKLVYWRIREKLGGKFRAAISGGGALQPETEKFFNAIGFRLLEAYGMTETSPVVSIKNSRHPRTNNVGKPLPGFQVKVVQEKDGEIAGPEPLKPGKKGLLLVKGRQVMKGYYNRDDLTANIIDQDGWLNTGDLAMISYDGEIKIVGRAKDTIVLLGGENIEPAVIEKALNASPYIERSVVLGQDKKYVGALIVPDEIQVTTYAEDNGIVYDNYEALLETNEIQNLFRTEIDTLVNARTGFRTCERIFKFCLLKESFQIGRDINAKQELMRHKITKTYRKQISRIFQ